MAEEVGYLNHASRFRMFPFVAAAIRRLNEAGLPVIVVTNQSGVGRGYFPESLVHTVNKLMKQQLAKAGANIDAIYYCRPTSPETGTCRNPRPAILAQSPLHPPRDFHRRFWVVVRSVVLGLPGHARQ